MDLNYYYHRHQVSLMMAKSAVLADVRATHMGFAKGYAALIRRERALRSSAASVSRRV